MKCGRGDSEDDWCWLKKLDRFFVFFGLSSATVPRGPHSGAGLFRWAVFSSKKRRQVLDKGGKLKSELEAKSRRGFRLYW